MDTIAEPSIARLDLRTITYSFSKLPGSAITDAISLGRDGPGEAISGYVVRAAFRGMPMADRHRWLWSWIEETVGSDANQFGFVQLYSPDEFEVSVASRAGQKTAIVHYRDLWGKAESKRTSLADALSAKYERFRPFAAQQWKFLPYDSAGGYEDWVALDNLFPQAFQGVEPNRGLEGSLVDAQRESLVERMKSYFSNVSWDKFALLSPELATKRANYDPQAVRKAVIASGAFDEEKIMPYTLFPLDRRFLYYELEQGLLNRPRPELAENLAGNEFLNAVPLPRRSSEARPLLSTGLYDRHLHDRGTFGFPIFTTPKAAVGTLFDEPAPPVPTANLAPAAWEVLRAAYGLGGDLAGEAARALVRRLFRAALALGHAPRFESDHRESLAQDWMHLPLPKEPTILAELAAAGGLVATLLDPLQTVRPALREILGSDYARLAVVARPEGTAGPVDTSVTYRYFGGGRGRWEPRTPLAAALTNDAGPLGEGWRDAWGDVVGDLYLNPSTYLANVPERVWRFELGGYPVMKKWLGYRQASRRDGKPLTPTELEHLRSIVHRLAALLALYPHLDALYERTIENAFTAEELGLRGVVP